MKRLILAAATTVLFTNCFAYETADDVLNSCGVKDAQDVEKATRLYINCMGYVTGIIGGVLMMQAAYPKNAPIICFPKDYVVSQQEGAKVVSMWIELNLKDPARDSARVSVLTALANTYRCSE